MKERAAVEDEEDGQSTKTDLKRDDCPVENSAEVVFNSVAPFVNFFPKGARDTRRQDKGTAYRCTQKQLSLRANTFDILFWNRRSPIQNPFSGIRSTSRVHSEAKCPRAPL